MTGLVDTVRGKVQNTCLISGRLKKEGCSVFLKDAPRRRLIVDFDKPGSPLHEKETRCDYLLLAEDADFSGWVVPIELKKGRLDASKAAKQLKAGAKIAEKLVPDSISVNFRPVAAVGGSKAERVELRAKKNRVWFHGTSEIIRLIKCGERLIDAFKESDT